MKKTRHSARLCSVIVSVLAILISCTPPVRVPVAPPAAPTNFNVNGVSYTCIELRWDDTSNNEDNFIIQRAEDIDFTINIAESVIDANAVFYRDYNSIAEGITRYYRIFARNGEGDSDIVGTVSATTPSAPVTPANSRIADHTVINRLRMGTIPTTIIDQARANVRIAYGHTSHGSQIMSGMSGLSSFAFGTGCTGAYTGISGLFSYNDDGSGGALHLAEDMGDYGSAYGAADLNQPDYTAWDDATRSYLNSHTNINVVIWSWCAGVSHASEDNISDDYLARMNQLEIDYPAVDFVYMTGHLDGSGTSGNLHLRNEQIRAYCLANGKWLFDFADIETHDPDMVEFVLRHPNDACEYDFDNNGFIDMDNGDRNWALDWQNTHTENTEWYNCGAAHSQSLNANMKAYAAWWLWCRLAGWDGN